MLRYDSLDDVAVDEEELAEKNLHGNPPKLPDVKLPFRDPFLRVILMSIGAVGLIFWMTHSYGNQRAVMLLRISMVVFFTLFAGFCAVLSFYFRRSLQRRENLLAVGEYNVFWVIQQSQWQQFIEKEYGLFGRRARFCRKTLGTYGRCLVPVFFCSLLLIMILVYFIMPSLSREFLGTNIFLKMILVSFVLWGFAALTVMLLILMLLYEKIAVNFSTTVPVIIWKDSFYLDGQIYFLSTNRRSQLELMCGKSQQRINLISLVTEKVLEDQSKFSKEIEMYELTEGKDMLLLSIRTSDEVMYLPVPFGQEDEARHLVGELQAFSFISY